MRWREWVKRLLDKGSLRGRLGRRGPAWTGAVRLTLEELEDRTVLSTFTVLNLDDGGTGSLRQAILDANASNGLDTILFDSNLADSAIPLTSSQLMITDDVLIDTFGVSNLTVSGNNRRRVFEIDGATVNITGLTISNGAAGFGAGIYNNAGDLTLTRCTVTNCQATFNGVHLAGGGGIYSLDGSLTLNSCSTLANSASMGGGIDVSGGSLAITGCTIADNAAPSGGGVLVEDHCAATLTNSRVVQNGLATTIGFGAGILVQNGAGLAVVGSAISSNSSPSGTGNGLAVLSASASLSNCQINGNSGASSAVYLQAGSVSLDHCEVADNTDSNGVGAIEDVSGRLAVADSIITNNRGTQVGGIWSRGTGSIVTLTNVTITNNAPAGLSLTSSGGNTTLTNCTIAGNAGGPTSAAGGLYVDGGTLTMINCTVSGNSGGNAGAFYILGTGPTSLINCTVTDNRATIEVGGIECFHAGHTVSMWNTIVAGNGCNDSSGDIIGFIASAGHNLVGDGANSSGLGVNGDLVGTHTSLLNPGLGPLQDNGGPLLGPMGHTTAMLTRALLPDSMAIDYGDNAVAELPFNISTDQRGLARPIDGVVDIGAYELQPPPEVTNVIPAVGPLTGGTPVTISGAHFQAGINLQVYFGTVAASEVTFSSDSFITAVSPSGTPGTVDVRIINPDGQQSPVTAADRYTIPHLAFVEQPTQVHSGRSFSVEVALVDDAGNVAPIDSTDEITLHLGDPSGPSLQSTTLELGRAQFDDVFLPLDIIGASVRLYVTDTEGYGPAISAEIELPHPVVTAVTPHVGPTAGNTLVTITGSGFQAGARVFFGSSEATRVFFTSDTFLTALNPSGTAGNLVDVRVLNPNGLESPTSPSAVFTYEASGTGGSGLSSTTLVVTRTDDSGPGSLRQVIQDAPNYSTITFDHTLAGTTITLTSGEIYLSGKQLQILGPEDKVTISGNESSRVFELRDDAALTLLNLHLTGGVAVTGGAIAAVSSQLTLLSCLLTENRAVSDPPILAAGGAVFATFSSMQIDGCTFSDNSGRRGGAISSDHSQVIVSGSIFSRNQAKFGASASSAGDKWNVSQSQFIDNVVDPFRDESLDPPGGGGFYSLASTLIATDSGFSNNRGPAGEVGGGLLVLGSRAELTRCRLSNNTGWGDGAGIFAKDEVTRAVITLDECDVSDNDASDGSLLTAAGISAIDATQTIVRHSTIAHNVGSDVGGVAARALTISDSTIDDNAGNTGGFKVFFGTSIVSRCTVSNNRGGGCRRVRNGSARRHANGQ